MNGSELSSAYVAAGSPQPPTPEWSDWVGRALAAARQLAAEDGPEAAADLLGGLRSDLQLPVDPEALLVEARMRLRSGRPGAARTLLSIALGHAPDHVGALRLRARVVASQGDLRGAVQDGLRVLARTPDLDLVHSTLVRQQLIGDWEGASALLREQRSVLPALDDAAAQAEVELGPDATPAEVVALAIKPWHRRLPDDAPRERIEEAIPLLQADLDDEPSNPRNWERLAISQLGGDRPEAAVASFTRLVDLEPTEEQGWFGLARAEFACGRPSAALAAADRALALNPESHRSRMVRLEAAAQLPDPIGQLTAVDDRHRLLMETKDEGITTALAPLLEHDGDHRGAAAMRAMAGLDARSRPIERPAAPVDGLVVYTVVTGGYEQPSDPREVLGDNADVVIFTDDTAALPASLRSIARPLEFDGPPQLASRHPKMLPHRYFPDHERSLYIDANFHLLSDPRPLVDGLSAARPMTVLEHSERDTPVAEARLVVERGFASWADVRAHFERQRAAGFDPAASSLSYGGFLGRRHADPSVVAAMEQWWAAFEHGVRRDQLSLDFALWSGGVTPNRLRLHNHRNAHWIRIPHA